MKRAITIGVVCLLVGLSCARKSAVDEATANSSGEATAAGNAEQARAMLETGKEHFRNDDDQKALEAFQQAIKLDPDLAEAYFRLGLAHDVMGDEQEAEDAYKKAVQAYKKYFARDENEKDAEAHYILAQTYAGLHLHSEAVREYRQAVRLRDNDADIYYDLGMALTRLAQYDEAAAAFSKSLELDPGNFRAEDGLEEAREGMKRIKAGRKHQEDLIKKQKKEEELKKQKEGTTPEGNAKPAGSTGA